MRSPAAASSLWRSIRLGRFLRLHPIARIVVIVYMVRLHTSSTRPRREEGGEARCDWTWRRAAALTLTRHDARVQLLLHIWVAIVLATYTPETHDATTGPVRPKQS